MVAVQSSNAVHAAPQKSEDVEKLASLASQNDFHAFASMVLAGLPFPPLPVMVRQGEDGEYAIASSFDLLQQAIVAQQVALQSGTNTRTTSTAKTAAEVVEAKTAMLMGLQQDMAAHVQDMQTARETTGDAFLEKAYDIYCCAFRAYLLDNYPVCTRDLRFYPMQDVPKNHTLMEQARSHLRGSFIMSAAGYANVVSPFDGTPAPSYAAVVRFYALDLGSLCEETTRTS